jgi:hypothetical protein
MALDTKPRRRNRTLLGEQSGLLYDDLFANQQSGGFLDSVNTNIRPSTSMKETFRTGIAKAPNTLGGSPAMGLAKTAAGFMPYGTLALGALQTLGGLGYALSEGNKPLEQYKATPETLRTISDAETMATMGFTPEQKAAFRTNLGTQTETQFRNATELSGGNLSRALGATTQTGRLNALNRFAESDAQLKQSNIRYRDSVTRKIQELADRNVQMNNQRRMMVDQAFGRAGSSGLTNMASYFNLGSALSSLG